MSTRYCVSQCVTALWVSTWAWGSGEAVKFDGIKPRYLFSWVLTSEIWNSELLLWKVKWSSEYGFSEPDKVMSQIYLTTIIAEIQFFRILAFLLIKTYLKCLNKKRNFFCLQIHAFAMILLIFEQNYIKFPHPCAREYGNVFWWKYYLKRGIIFGNI